MLCVSPVTTTVSLHMYEMWHLNIYSYTVINVWADIAFTTNDLAGTLFFCDLIFHLFSATDWGK